MANERAIEEILEGIVPQKSGGGGGIMHMTFNISNQLGGIIQFSFNNK